jgi:hypothetical protein
MAEAMRTLAFGEIDFLREDPDMLALLHRALGLLASDDSAARAHLEAFLALHALYSIPHPARREMADRALAMARRVGDRDALVEVLGAHSWTDMDPERRGERLAIADELVRVAPSTMPYATCEGHVFRFIALVESGDIQRADAALAAARPAARVPISQWMVLQWEAVRAMLAGRLADAEALSIRGAEAAREAGAPPSVVEFQFVGLLWCIRAVQGRLPELDPFVGMVRALPDRPAWSFAGEAQLACEMGDPGAARCALDEAVARGLLEAPRIVGWTTTMTGAADVCAALMDRSLATSLYELLAPSADVMSTHAGPLGRAVGRLALTLGRRDEAEDLLRAAVALCERMDARGHLAITRYELGRLLLPGAEGAELLERARAGAEELGMPGWARRAQAALTGPNAAHAG